jgi:hypothetical protein
MTNHAQHLIEAASPEQLQFLRSLSSRRGVSFSRPTSSADAGRQIEDLLAKEVPTVEDIERELRGIREELSVGAGAVALVDDDELGGYGSTAHWRR